MPFGPKNLIDIADEELAKLRPVVGLAGYFVSESGDVFCIRKLRPHIDPDGYGRVTIKALGTSRAVHRMVCQTFHGDPLPHQKEVRHLDGNPANNAASNLAWGTRKENGEDAGRHGTMKGSKNANSKLDEEKVLRIKQMLARGFKRRKIAGEFNVSIGTIKAIATGRNWGHVQLS